MMTKLKICYYYNNFANAPITFHFVQLSYFLNELVLLAAWKRLKNQHNKSTREKVK